MKRKEGNQYHWTPIGKSVICSVLKAKDRNNYAYYKHVNYSVEISYVLVDFRAVFSPLLEALRD